MINSRRQSHVASLALTLVACLLFNSAPALAATELSSAITVPYQATYSEKYRPYKNQLEATINKDPQLLGHIRKQLRQANLPASLVLVPMIESAYKADAVSPKSAAGLWQFMPATARQYGLIVEKHNDQRFDTHLSTEAAVKYLAYLHRLFDGDVSLTLAAYNAGEGRVGKAITRAGSAEFSQLALPKETRHYVARFHALANLLDIQNPSRIAVDPKVQRVLIDLLEVKPLFDMSPIAPLIVL